MALLESFDDINANGKKGDWAFSQGGVYIAILYGDDRFKEMVVLAIDPVVGPGQAHWEWDGNREEPTLTPSILVWGNGKDQPATWHGYLRAGKLVDA